MTHFSIFYIVRILWARLNHRGITEVLVNDYPETLQEILKAHPGLIRPAKVEVMKPWMIEAIGALRAGNKVAAISAHRTATGIGLLESKWLFDEICNNAALDFTYRTPDFEAEHRKRVEALPRSFREAARQAWKGPR